MSTHEFEAFARSRGLRPRTIAPDGRWRRCPTEDHPKSRNGAYKLAMDGRVGWVQNWAVDESPVMWRADNDGELPEFDVDAFRRHREAEERKQANAIRAARAFYEGCDPLLGGHPYLTSHGLDMTGCAGLKVDSAGWLVVPAYRGSVVHSVQRISPEGEKRFWRGAPVAGTTYTVDRRGAVVTILCEGLATGLACYHAVPGSRIVVAWNAGNLAALEIGLAGMAVIAADNDHGTQERLGDNPGIQAGEKAAERLGCGVAYPEGVQGTDWCDLRMERIDARMARKSEYETRASVERLVDGEIRAEIMRHAVFVRRTP